MQNFRNLKELGANAELLRKPHTSCALYYAYANAGASPKWLYVLANLLHGFMKTSSVDMQKEVPGE